MNVLLSLATFGGGRADRARPKSHSWDAGESTATETTVLCSL